MGGFAGVRLAPVRPSTASASSDLCLTVPATLERPRIDHRRAVITRELSVWIRARHLADVRFERCFFRARRSDVRGIICRSSRR